MIPFKYQFLTKPCKGCHKSITKTWQVKRKEWEATKYCSKICSLNSLRKYWDSEFRELRMGSRNPNYKNGKGMIIHGYKYITVNGKQVRFHRYIMEIFLGRKLNRNEDIHHKNENKLDNRIENLMIINHGEHVSYHNRMRKLKSQMRTA